MNVRLPLYWIRVLALGSACLLTAVSCSQENGRETDLVQAEAYLDIADVYRQQGQFRSASIELQNALQLAPGNARALRILSQIDMEVGNVGEAIRILGDLRASQPDDQQTTLLLAEANLMAGELGQSLSLLQTLQPSAPEDRALRNWIRGRALTLSGNTVEAEEAFQRILAEDPANIRALIGLSQLAYTNSDLEQARAYLEQASEIDPNDLDVWIWSGVYATLNGQYPEAEQSFNEALELMGNYDTMTAKRYSVLQAIQVPLQMQQKNAEAMRYAQIIADTPMGQFQSSYSNANALFQQGNFAEAQRALQTTLELAPENPASNLLLGMTNYALGDYAAAASSLGRFVDIATTAQPVKILAATQIQLGNPEEAVAILEEARERFPNDGSLLAMLGISQRTTGQIDESIESFNAALATNQNPAEVHFLLAGSHFLREDTDAAVQSLEQALELNPGFNQAMTGLVEIYLNQGETDRARARVETWRQQNPRSSFLNNLAGGLATMSGQPDQARNFYNNTLASEPANREARLRLAELAIIEADYARAQEEYQVMLSREPTDENAIRGFLSTGSALDNEPGSIARVQEIVDNYPSSYIPAVVLSQYLTRRGDLTRALELAELAYQRIEVAATESNLVNVLLVRASDLARSGDPDAATQAVDRALSIQGNNIRALTAAAQLANLAGNRDAANGFVDRLKSLEAESGLGSELEADLLLANNDRSGALEIYRQTWESVASSSAASKLYLALLRGGQQQEASDFLSEWLSAKPQDGAANMFMGMNHQAANRESDAILRYETALRSLPNNVIALNNLAWMYQDSNPERALELAVRAVQLDPENADVLDTFGWLLYKQNRADEAIQVLQRAQQLSPDSDSIAEHLETVQSQ